MNDQEITTNTPTDITTTAPRPWIEPVFERVALREALSGSSDNFTSEDFTTYYSS